MVKNYWTFGTAGQLVFGRGCLQQISNIARRCQWQRVLIVTDTNIEEAGLVQRVRAPLVEAACEIDVFTAGEAEPSIATAVKSLAFAKECAPDVVIGLGGGSNMDLSKNTAAALTHAMQPQDCFGFDNVPGPIMPLVCIPTTAGTGSEVSHSMVLTDTENQIKVSGQSEHFRPDFAFVDPALTDNCPQQVTADSGIDALTHAIEAITAVDYDKLEIPSGETCAYDGRFLLSDSLAQRAIELCGAHLETAVETGDNTVARDGMALAATLAGMAFSNSGVALVHAIEYPLGGVLHCSHGLGNGLLLPYVMRFNLRERIETMAKIASWLGVDTTGLAAAEAASAGIDRIEEIRKSIGIPHRLRDIGATRDQLEMFADKTMPIQRLFWLNPRRATKDDILEILNDAF